VDILRYPLPVSGGRVATLTGKEEEVATKAFALLAWVSLVGADPLLDSWEFDPSGAWKVELAASLERTENDSWELEDSGLLNPFERD
jgi:hypothetical protein